MKEQLREKGLEELRKVYGALVEIIKKDKDDLGLMQVEMDTLAIIMGKNLEAQRQHLAELERATSSSSSSSSLQTVAAPPTRIQQPIKGLTELLEESQQRIAEYQLREKSLEELRNYYGALVEIIKLDKDNLGLMQFEMDTLAIIMDKNLEAQLQHMAKQKQADSEKETSMPNSSSSSLQTVAVPPKLMQQPIKGLKELLEESHKRKAEEQENYTGKKSKAVKGKSDYESERGRR